jgi:hypothetical protein
MTKKELKLMIREVAREEVYRVLPELLKEAVTETLTEMVQRKPVEKKKKNSGISKRSILEEIGYIGYGLAEDHDDDDDTLRFDSRDLNHVAQHAGVPVPMNGGLRAYETEMGQSSYSAVDPELGDMGVAPAPSIPGGDMPDFLLNAIGKAKSIVDRADQMKNYRPGMK